MATKKEQSKPPEGWTPRVYRCVAKLSHHWKIDTPHGDKYVWGRCLNCKRRRLFRASWPQGYIFWKQEAWERRREEARRRRAERRKARVQARLEAELRRA